MEQASQSAATLSNYMYLKYILKCRLHRETPFRNNKHSIKSYQYLLAYLTSACVLPIHFTLYQPEVCHGPYIVL